jgi:hypothetical protein
MSAPIQPGLCVELATFRAVLDADGAVTLERRDGATAQLDPAEVYDLLRLFATPGVRPLVNRAAVARAKQAYDAS